MYRKVNILASLVILVALISLIGPLSTSRRVSGQGIEQPVIPTPQRERPTVGNSYEILLRSRRFTPEVGIEPALVRGEIGITTLELGRVHVLLQLFDAPTPEEKTALHSAGIELLNYIPRNAWFASIPAGNLAATFATPELANIVRWAGVIRPEDKVPTDIWAGQIGSWAIAEDGRARLAVSFFDDVPLEVARQIVSRHGAVVEGEVLISNKLLILVQPEEIPALALEDAVRWIDQVPPPPVPHNDGARAAVNVDQVQAAPYNLSGQGVIVGIWDGGAVDWNHDDFDRPDGTSRVISRTAAIDDHATHVAGTMGGNGARSQAAGGTNRQWRGMAPNIGIVSYDFYDPINDYNEAINTFHINLSQNSWGRCIAGPAFPENECGYVWPFGNCGDYGDYRYNAREFDRIIVERRIPVIFAAGNERNDGDCGMNPNPPFENYRNITPPGSAKNIITVGATNSNDNSMTWFSSWGPVDDGRLKPEVVAPGCQSGGDGGINSTIPDNLFTDEDGDGVDDYSYPYDIMCGTSMAAPVVSGIGALIIEQYRKIYNADPWPSTIKALLVQSAHDLDDGTSWYNPGPDYASGYGLVDAKAAVDLVRARALRQGIITSTNGFELFQIWVLTGTAQLKVTLAWDDPPAVENAARTLVNNLDLTLWDPNNRMYWPWYLDPEHPEQPALTHFDEINNLEQVLVQNPQPGKWVILVSGSSVPQPPQSFSLVSESLFDILEPSRGSQVYAGQASHPQKVIISTTKPRSGLRANDFQVTIGGQPASILTFYEGSDRYVLEVMPAPPPSNGSYDLSVMVPTAQAWNIKEGAVLFADTANVDVVLVIDRSGSMGTDKMNAAKDAAKQFVDFMQTGDMVGVVSFDDRIETNFPLTTIEPPSSVSPIFSDNMESGTGNWSADVPWGLTTASSHSPSHAWTDSPGGNYANNVNISLRTAAPIHVPSTITTPVLSFWQRYDLESGYDRGYIEVSTDGGSTWAQLGSYVTGSNLSWHRIERDLTAYKGQNILIRFRLQTDSSVTYDGWYIDDTTVGQSTTDTKTLAKSAIDSLYSRGTTSIGGGLQRGQEELSTRGNPNHPWAIVLLSDGLENTAPYVADVLPIIRASKTVVHTIGLGSDADEALMLDIASQTGGTYHFAPTPEELSGIYNTIAGAVANRQILLAARGIAQQGVTDQVDVVVDSTVSDATFSVSWSNSSSIINLTLRKPNGDIIDPTVAMSDPNIEYVAGSTYRYYRIKAPTLVAGVWQMRITGGSISATEDKGVITATSGEPYLARVTAQASLTMRFYLDRDHYLTTEPIKFIVTLSDNQPIRDATVRVSVQPPSQSALVVRSSKWVEVNGDAVPDPARVAEIKAAYAQAPMIVDLYDDGMHGDGLANDGVYANTFGGTFNAGTYVFSASASGTSNANETFSRYAEISTYIPQNPNPNIHRVYLPAVTRNYSSGTTYNWLDATVGGTIVAQGDDTYQYVSLPFAFNFYGNTYTGLYVSSNGYVSFGSGYSSYSNGCIPSTAIPNNAIYAFWDDLVPTGGSNGNIYVKQIDGGTFVIEWYRVRQYGSSNYQTFEIVLRNDHSITLQYQSVSNTGSATVGVENATGTLAKQYICNGVGSPLTNQLAIRYTTP